MAQRPGPGAGASNVQMMKVGDDAFRNMGKTSAEFFAMMYGSLVRQLTVDHPGPGGIDQVNRLLDDIGYKIGIRIIDEYLAKSGMRSCGSFHDTADAIACVGLKMFLGFTAAVGNVSDDGYTLVFDETPLTLFVDLPEQYIRGRLNYCNILCGVVRGALSQVGFNVTATFTKDKLLGDPRNEIRISQQPVHVAKKPRN
jgi:hypothetical protein